MPFDILYMIFICLLLQLCLYLAPFLRYYRLFPKNKGRHVTVTTSIQGKVVILTLNSHLANQFTKFEVSRFGRSR